MTNEIVIVGGSGFAKEMVYLLENSYPANGEKWKICGCVDETLSIDDKVLGYPVLGNDEWLLNYDRQLNVVIGIGDPKAKKRVAQKLKKNKNLCFPNIIAQTVRLGREVKIGEGCIICDMNILTVNICLGNFVTLNLSNTIGHDSQIGEYVTINPGCNISGNVRIEDMVTVGTGTKIIQGITIGEESILGAGSVIIRDVNKRNTVVGNPGRIVKEW